MKKFETFRKEMDRLIEGLTEEEREKIDLSLSRLGDEIELLELKYHRAIRDRAAVHSLLKKTSEDLIGRYQIIFEYSGTAMAVVEQNGIISLVNSNFERLFGYTRDEVENVLKFPRLVDETMRDTMVRYHSQRLAGKSDVPRYYESKVIDSEGQVRDISISVGLFPGSKQIIVSIMDITDRKRAEEAVSKTNEKMAILNSLTRHDIINQLTPLFMHLELAREDTDDPDLLGSLDAMEKIAANIQKHVEFMKNYQEIGVESPGWQNVADVIREGASSLPLGDVPLYVGFANLWIYADPLLQKVFYNLVENAIRHAGPITAIRFSCRRADGEISIFCEDDGTGIPEEEKERIFKREFYKNTGLGLFLSREILSITGIRIRESGVPAEGARFEISVPGGCWIIGEKGSLPSSSAVPDL